MKPEGKAYEEEVCVPHVWEEINKEHHLITKPVSDYIRSLEDDLKQTREKLTEALKHEPNIVKQLKAQKLLGDMMTADSNLYEKILDTPGFAFAFNELCKLAEK